MAKTFKPVDLVNGDARRTATTASQETRLRYDGWKSAPREKAEPADEQPTADKPADKPASGSKPAPKQS